MYRFRSTENLLDKFNELENQEIYFADLESLNDSMEGVRDYYWSGDDIVWKNFFKHYIYCLDHLVSLTYLLPQEEELTAQDIPIFYNPQEIPTEIYRERMDRIYDRFFKDKSINEYILFLSGTSKEIYEEELYVHLKMLHMYALEAVYEMQLEYGLSSMRKNPFSDIKETSMLYELVSMLNEYKSLPDDIFSYEKILGIQKRAFKTWDIISAYDAYPKSIDAKRLNYIINGFIEDYLKEITKLTYPECYVACFMDNCTNAAVWGYYGDSHKGVCLKFKTKNSDSPTISLKGIVGYHSLSGNMYAYKEFDFRQMKYSTQFPKHDFFRGIGRLPAEQLFSQWYMDSEGNISTCAKDLLGGSLNLNGDPINAWRKSYWGTYEDAYLNKLPDWENEKEHRLLLNSFLGSYSKPGDRKLKYKFEDLEAIIFGMKTPIEDKLRIINIIKHKCELENRSDFHFYEAVYSRTQGEMELQELMIR